MRALLSTHAGLVFAGLASFVLMGAGQSLYGPAIPAFGRDYGIDTAVAALIVTAHWIGCTLGVGLMYRHGDQVTPRMALAAMAIGAAGIAAGWGWPLALLGAGVFGMGYGLSTVTYNHRFLMTFGARGPSMLSLLNAIFGVGAIGAPLVFVALGNDPRLSYLAIAALAAVILLAARVPAPPRAALPPGPRGRLALRWRILAFGMAAIGIEASLIGLGPVALIALGTTETAAAAYLSLFFVAFLAARLLLALVAGAVPPFAICTGAVAATAVLAVLLAVTGWAPLFAATGASAALFFPGFYMTAVRQMGDDPRIGSIVIAAGLVGGIAAPLLLGLLMQGLGEAALFPLIAVVAGGLTLQAVLGWPRPRET